MSKEWYANASLGLAVTYKPSTLVDKSILRGFTLLLDGYMILERK